MGTIFSIAGCQGVIGTWAAYRLDTGIQAHGQRAVGHVLGKSLPLESGGDGEYDVKYWFQLPSGERIEARREVPRAQWEKILVGDTLVILYAAQSPKRNFPQGGGVTSVGVSVFVSLLSAVFGAFGAILIASFIRGKSAEA